MKEGKNKSKKVKKVIRGKKSKPNMSFRQGSQTNK